MPIAGGPESFGKLRAESRSTCPRQVSSVRYQVSGIRYQVSGIRYQVSGIRRARCAPALGPGAAPAEAVRHAGGRRAVLRTGRRRSSRASPCRYKPTPAPLQQTWQFGPAAASAPAWRSECRSSRSLVCRQMRRRVSFVRQFQEVRSGGVQNFPGGLAGKLLVPALAGHRPGGVVCRQSAVVCK